MDKITARDEYRSIRRHLIGGSVIALLLTAGVGGWAATTELSGAVIAPGSVVVDSNVKKVQHLTGGIVGELLVRDGLRVRSGEVVLRLDETVTRANLAKDLTSTLRTKSKSDPKVEPKVGPKDLTQGTPEFEAEIGKISPTSIIYEAENTAEALRIGEKAQPQLGLIDVVLEDEDGILCASRLKNLSPSTRMVLISAYPDREFRRRALSAGAIAFLDKKDLDTASVRQVIEDALR